MKIKDYGFPVVRIYDMYQVMLYISNRVMPVDEYVSRRTDGSPILVQVFKKEETFELFQKYRKRELDFDEIYAHVK